MGEAREPTLATGMDLLKLLERERTDPPRTSAEHELRQDVILDFLDRLLDEVRAEERARISFQLGLVAGEGYKLFNDTLSALERLMDVTFAPNPGVPKAHLRKLIEDARSFSFSESSAKPKESPD